MANRLSSSVASAWRSCGVNDCGSRSPSDAATTSSQVARFMRSTTERRMLRAGVPSAGLYLGRSVRAKHEDVPPDPRLRPLEPIDGEAAEQVGQNAHRFAAG